MVFARIRERKFYEEDGPEFEGHYAWEFEDEEGDHYITTRNMLRTIVCMCIDSTTFRRTL